MNGWGRSFEPRFKDVDPKFVVVGRFPNGDAMPHGVPTIWTRRFMGLKVADNPDGTIRVQVYGPAPNDFARSVFYKQPSPHQNHGWP